MDLNGKLVNPYIVGASVGDTELFFDRKRILKQVPSLLANRDNNLIFINGPRRSGKTSVLKRLEKELSTRQFIPIYFDLQPYAEELMGRLLYLIAKKILQTLNIKEPYPEYKFDSEGEFFIEKFLKNMQQHLNKRRLVFLFDEFDIFDRPASYGEESAVRLFVPFVTKIVNEKIGPALILAIGRYYSDISHRYKSLMRISARTYNIWTLPESDAKKLVRYAESDGKSNMTLKFDDRAVKKILEISGKHPFFLQLISSIIWDIKHENSDGSVPTVIPEDINDFLIERVFESGENTFEWIWDGLNRYEKIFVSTMGEFLKSNTYVTLSNIKTLIEQNDRDLADEIDFELVAKHLVSRKVITKNGNNYEFTIRIFGLWVSKHKTLKDTIFGTEPAIKIYEAALEYFKQGDYKRTIDNCQQVLKIKPDDIKALLLIGRAYLKDGNYEVAIGFLERAYNKNRSVAKFLSNAYKALAEKSTDINEKISNFRRSFELYKLQDPSSFFEFLYSIIRNGSLEIAQKVLSEFRDIFGENNEEFNKIFHAIKIEQLKYRLHKLESGGKWIDAIKTVNDLLVLDITSKNRWLRKMEFLKKKLLSEILRYKIEKFLRINYLNQIPILIGKLLQFKIDVVLLLNYSKKVLDQLLQDPKIFYHRRYIISGRISNSSWNNLKIVVSTSSGVCLYTYSQNNTNFLFSNYLPHYLGVNTLSFSQDDKYLASGGEDGIIKIWDVMSGELIRELDAHYLGVNTLSFSQDDKYLASGGEDGIIKIWDVMSGKLIREQKMSGSIISLRYFPLKGGTALITLDENGIILKIKGNHLRHKTKFKLPDLKINIVSFISKDGDLLASGGEDGAVKIWEVKKMKVKFILYKSETSINSISTSCDRNLIVQCDKGGNITIWDIKKKQEVFNHKDSDAGVNTVAISCDKNLLAYGTIKGKVLLMNIEKKQIIWEFKEEPQLSVNAVKFSFDNRYLIWAGNFRGGVRMLEIGNKDLITLKGNKNAIFSLAVSYDNQFIAAGGGKELIIWKLMDESSILKLVGHSGRIRSVVFLPTNNNIIATGGEDGKILIWNIKRGKYEILSESVQKYTSLCFSNDGKLLAASSSDGSISVWKVNRILSNIGGAYGK